jgi:hypothetical protein
MGLSLGNVYSLIQPDDKETLKTAHYADTDVKMLIAVTKFFMNLFDDQPSPGKIERYFPRTRAGNKKESENEVQAGSDDDSELSSCSDSEYMEDA